MSSKVGTVKWFNESKGFGFIQQTDGGRDVFVHYKSIQGEGHKSLYEGDPVEYEIQQTSQGLTAINVVKK
ncbi:cold-shock DNA-binding domain protein [Ceratobasidium sp. AG-Ba]|nr:cold-shock DNA-binding domain protein [Ceratobasidium sp. AG-Ba]QRW02737.1 cold-shock DNA-binding domain protein [Ceratobasidium sp. AG-Ba]